MKKLLINVSNRHELIFKFFLVAASIFIIVFALPREIQFNYEVQEGKPWAYENLEAPFDYAIAKSESELIKERAESLKGFHPFFNMDTALAESKINSFISAFSKTRKNSGKDNDRLQQFGAGLLREIYGTGIIFLNDQYEHVAPSYTITLLKDRVAEEKEVGSFYTLQTAYNQIATEVERKFNKDSAGNSQLISLLENALAHNVIYNDEETKKWSSEAINNVSPYRGKIQKGETVIRKGEVVDSEHLRRIESLKMEIKNRDMNGMNRQLIVLGHLILVSLSMLMLIIFLGLFRKETYGDNRRILFMMLNMVIMILLFLWARKAETVDLYLVPLCILPIIIRTFYDVRTALFTHTCILLILGFVTPNGFEFMFIQTIAGMAAIFSSTNMRNRSQFLTTAVIIFLAYSISFIGISTLHEGSWKEIDWSNIRWFVGNVIITLFAFPLIFIFEKLFGFTSDISLMELADSNSKLLRELAFKAPGTFQHSLQVANLAEAAIFEIGGNTLLVRAGALYHDIGKIDMPNYFIENQNLQLNPHDELAFEESARIIKSHVIRGIEKAKKHRLPEQVIDFIRTHHGTMRLQYFYQSFLKSFPNDRIIEDEFRYQGVLPFSKETAVVMMADGVEASSKSLKTPDMESIDKLVENIINHQVEQNQFINSNITFKDLSTIKKVFKKMLISIYHVRIEYPK